MANPTVAAGLPKAFLDFAVSRGADLRTLAEQSQICPDDLKEPNNRIPLANYVQLLQAGIELCNEPALALLFGEAVRMQKISIVGMIGECAESAEVGRRLFNRFLDLIIDPDDGAVSERLEFIPDNGSIWVKFTSAVYEDYPLIAQSAFARCITGAREVSASSPTSMNSLFPKAIHFTHEEPAYRSEYDRIFEVPLFFGSHMNAWLFDKKLLSMRMPRTNPYLSQILTAHAEELLKDLELLKSTRGRVEGLLIPALHTGNVRMDMVADKMGVSRQTLFRKLKAEGVTFEKVLNELRYKLAVKYLNGKNAPVSQTAYLLGFSEPAAFSRAFKRWTGSSPRRCRLRNPEINDQRGSSRSGD